MVDYTYQRPARRGHAYHPVILPSLVENRSNIAVIIDTSGSMSERDLSQIVAETMQIIRTAGVGNVTVMTADYDVHWVGKAARAKDIKLIGGGGTDMGRAIEAAERLRPRPEVIVVLTDGETPWPKCAPRARVIVGLTDREGSAPAWARKVYVDAGGGR
jgi:predicted metal-dependent peptidase